MNTLLARTPPRTAPWRGLARVGGLLLLCGLPLPGCQPDAPPPVLPPLTVTVARPVEKEVVDATYFTGRTDGSEYVEIRARVGGYLNKILFKPGTQVKKGDLLVEIDDRPYKLALAQAEGDLARVKARVTRLAADVARARSLFTKQAMSREELDKVVGDQAEAVASVQSAEAAVDRAKLDLSWTKVYAPIGGLVSRDLVNAGNLIVADQTKLTTILRPDPMFVYFDIDERVVLRILGLIREGKFRSARENRVPIRMGLATDDGFPFEGYVNFVENKIDPTTGTMRIRGHFDNPPGENGSVRITAGMFARVRLDLGQPYKALLVPERVLLSDQNLKFAYVVAGNNKVERRTVRLGRLDQGWRAIEAGLAVTDRVIVNGLQRVRPGVVVEPEEGPLDGGPGDLQPTVAAKADPIPTKKN